MNFDSIDVSDRVGIESARLVSKLLLAAGSVAFVAYLLTLLPGIDRVVPRTPVTFAAALGAIATAVIVVLLVYAAPRIALLVRMSLDGPREAVEEIAAVVQWTVVLAAILVAHSGFAGVAHPLLDGGAWVYDVGFLLLAIPVVGFVAVHLYRGLDPSADLLAARVAEGTQSVEPMETASDPGASRSAEDVSSSDGSGASGGSGVN